MSFEIWIFLLREIFKKKREKKEKEKETKVSLRIDKCQFRSPLDFIISQRENTATRAPKLDRIS